MDYKLNQKAGGYFYDTRGKGSEKSCNILAYLHKGSSTYRVLQKNKDILLDYNDNGLSLHVTLLNVLICLNVPDHIKKIILDDSGEIRPELNAKVKQFYIMTFGSSGIHLGDGSIGDTYTIKGEWLAKVLKVNDPMHQNIISQFRTLFYNEIKKMYGQYGYTLDRVILPNYTVSRIISGPGIHTSIEIYAVPSYYYGVGTWTPHISLCSIPHIKTFKRLLYAEFEREAIKLARNPALQVGLTVAKKQLDVNGTKYNMFEESGLILGSQAVLIYGDIDIDMHVDISSVEFK
jgi:hypothetical protein